MNNAPIWLALLHNILQIAGADKWLLLVSWFALVFVALAHWIDEDSMTDFTFTFWTKAGPRDQRNCMNGWGRRTLTVQGKDRADAVCNLLRLVGRHNYGGMIE